MVGNQLSAVKADISSGHESLTQEERAKIEEEEDERLAAIQEAEEIRKNKHRKIEEEREKLRQSVRDKYGIRKKERRQEEIEIEQRLRAIDPLNPANQIAGPRLAPNTKASLEETGFTTKLIQGDLSQATTLVANKIQSLIPKGFSLFK
ncbi:putative complexin-1, partial [Fragariocoptes setiger]